MNNFRNQIVRLCIIPITSIVILLAFSTSVNLSGSHSQLSESGLYSNLSRIYNLYDSTKLKSVILGSSISARVLDTFVPSSFQPCVNLGMDAGATATSLHLFLDSEVYSEFVFIEANTFGIVPPEHGVTTLNAAQSINFRIKNTIPFIRETYRPSSVLYTKLKSLKDDSYGSHLKSTEPFRREDWSLHDATKILSEIEQKSDHIIFVNYPSKRQPNGKILNFITQTVSSNSNIHYLDLQNSKSSKSFLFTDQTHLTLKSARTIASSISSYAAKISTH